MSRPTSVDLTGPHERWREVPMPGAAAPFLLVRLDAPDETLALYGHFPAGFQRESPGGYDVAEEFLVLDGDLMLDGVSLGRGDLTYVPAHQVRSGMRSKHGCRVIAWFGGAAEFRAPAELPPSVDLGGTLTVSVLGVQAGPLLQAADATWTVVVDAGPGISGATDVVDLGMHRWTRGGVVTGPALVRTRS